MFKPTKRHQTWLLPPALEDLIPENDLSRLIPKVVEVLNLKTLLARYHRLGQNAYHPGMMLGVLFYAYSQGIFSSRRIAELLRFDVRFMHLAGNQQPDFRTLSDFRKHHVDLLTDYFVQIVRLCQKLGIPSLENVAIDGTKMMASASAKRQADKDWIKQLFEAARQSDDNEPEQSSGTEDTVNAALSDNRCLDQTLRDAYAQLEADDKLQKVNLTDPDCRTQKGIGPGYNVQAAVDNASGVIIAVDVVQDRNDQHQLIPMLQQMTANTGVAPAEVSADAGYGNQANCVYVKEQKINAYLAVPQHIPDDRGRFSRCYFRYDLNADAFLCPEGKLLKLLQVRQLRGVEIRIYRGVACNGCPHQSVCVRGGKRRYLKVSSGAFAQAEMKARLKSSTGKAAMRRRRETVEPVFGHLKENMGFRRFHLRGLSKVRGELALLCSAYNLKKLHRYLTMSGDSLFSIRIIAFIRSLTYNFHLRQAW